jgi:hypothetical protein
MSIPYLMRALGAGDRAEHSAHDLRTHGDAGHQRAGRDDYPAIGGLHFRVPLFVFV